MPIPPCWQSEEVSRIIRPDAEEISDHVFRAVHCTSDLYLADNSNGPKNPFPPEAFVDRFLADNEQDMLCVVIGESGTGKSHIIQWLRLEILKRNIENKVFLTIPKSGTSLRSILEKIINELPENEREPYLEKLSRAGNQLMTQEAKVVKFLNELAWFIEFDDCPQGVEPDLKKFLSTILTDTYFRQAHFLLPEHTIDLIIRHVFVDPEDRDVLGERREFELNDFPFDGADYVNAAANTQVALDFILGEDGLREQSVELTNHHLDKAISKTLDFSADNLINLMTDVRRHLAENNKCLILLIEDFARLQGIDNALLQALTTPNNQGEDSLCQLRWAMAVTTGYFRRIKDTVETRIKIVVDMDLSQPNSISTITSGYLNALRHGEDSLQGMDQTAENVPSFCMECNYIENCHDSFGEVDGIGLFPFTESAVEIMAHRTNSMNLEQQFNPRKYLRSVLENVLLNNYDHLQNTSFPSKNLLDSIGGQNKLTPVDLQRLQQLDGQNHERNRTLLELWDGSGRVTNLINNGVQEAFGIPLLQLETDPLPKADPLPRTDSGNGKDDPFIIAVREWHNNKQELSDSNVGKLRKLVFKSIVAFIDWDLEGFVEKEFAVETGRTIFKSANIDFENQKTLPQRYGIHLKIPAELDEAIALEALIRQQLSVKWDASETPTLYYTLLEVLEKWSNDLLSQIKELYKGTSAWDPSLAVAEMMALALLQSGNVNIDDDNYADIVTRDMWGTETPSIRGSFEDNYNILEQDGGNWSKWKNFINSLNTGTKGGAMGNFKNPTAIKYFLEKEFSDFSFSQNPPEAIVNQQKDLNLREIVKKYLQIKENFLSNLEAEKNANLQWKQELENDLGEGKSISELIDYLKNLLKLARSEGLQSAPEARLLSSNLDSEDTTLLENSIKNLDELPNENHVRSVIRIASIAEKRRHIKDIIKIGNTVVDAIKDAASNKKEKLKTEVGPGLKKSEDNITLSLGKISEILAKISKV